MEQKDDFIRTNNNGKSVHIYSDTWLLTLEEMTDGFKLLHNLNDYIEREMMMHAIRNCDQQNCNYSSSFLKQEAEFKYCLVQSGAPSEICLPGGFQEVLSNDPHVVYSISSSKEGAQESLIVLSKNTPGRNHKLMHELAFALATDYIIEGSKDPSKAYGFDNDRIKIALFKGSDFAMYDSYIDTISKYLHVEKSAKDGINVAEGKRW